MNGKPLRLFILLTLLLGFQILADESGTGLFSRIRALTFSLKMEDSLNELRKQPDPFDYWISRHGKNCFPTTRS